MIYPDVRCLRVTPGLVLALAVSLVSLTFSAPTIANESAELIPVGHFVGGKSLIGEDLSPGGQRLALVRMVGDKPTVSIKRYSSAGLEDESVHTLPASLFGWANWVDDSRILVGYTLVEIGPKGRATTTREIALIDAEKHELRTLLSYALNRYMANGADDFLDPLPDDDAHALLSFPVEEGFFPAVWKVNLDSGELTEVEPAQEGVEEWYVDHDGDVRIGMGWGDDGMALFLRADAGAKWEKLHDHPMFKDGNFQPVKFDLSGDTFYVISSMGKGRRAIYRFDLKTKSITKKIFQHDTYDAGSLLMSRDGRLLAASYVADNFELVFLDDDFRALMEKVDTLLPGRINIPFERDDEERLMLVYSSTEKAPGKLYLYDRDTEALHLVIEQNPLIDPSNMAQMKRVDYFARDGLGIPGYLTLPNGKEPTNLPTVIMPHGGPWVRDSLGYDDWAQFLASRGYAVLQPNYRGSTGFGAYFVGHGWGEWGKAMQTDVDDGANWLVSKGIADPDRICIVGGSYGGYAALMGAVKGNGIYKCAVAYAPVSDMSLFVDYIAESPGGKDAMKRILGEKGQKNARKVSPYHLAKKAGVPVLLAHGSHDIRVLYEHTTRMATALKKKKKDFEVISFEGGFHSMLQARHREKFLTELEAFLDRHIGDGME